MLKYHQTMDLPLTMQDKKNEHQPLELQQDY